MKFDLGILNDYVDKGLLRKAEDEDLVQYNYTDYCNNEGLWDDVTIFNRGNIYEKKTGLLIAKSMPKFMNFGQLSQEQQNTYLNQGFICTEKMDGCLGILYKYKGKIRCNSRGGFDNYVTDKIKQLLPKYVLLNHLLEYQTIITEVISKETKIICNYDEEDLWVITSYGTKSWEENPDIINNLIADVTYMKRVGHHNMTWDELLKWQRTANWEKEGFVLQFEDGSRVKIKSDDYLRIAKLRANLNKHTLWKVMKNDYEQGTTQLRQYLDTVPDELMETANRYLTELEKEMDLHRVQCTKDYEACKDIATRDLANYFKDNPTNYQGCIYNIRMVET